MTIRLTSIILAALSVTGCALAPLASPTAEPTASAPTPTAPLTAAPPANPTPVPTIATPAATAAPTAEVTPEPPTVTPVPATATPAPATATPNLPTVWSDPSKISGQVAWDIAPVVDSAGIVHVFSSTSVRGEGVLHLTNSSGKWTEEALTQPAEKGIDAVAWAALDDDGSIWLSYARYSFYNPCGFVCPRPHSRYDGLYVINNASGTWSEPLKLPEQLGEGAARLAVRGGVLHVAYGVFDSDAESTVVHYATNSSGDWNHREVGTGYWPQIVVDSAGTPWITFNRDDGTGWLAFAQEGAFSSVQVPGVEGSEGSIDALLLGEADRPVVVFSRWDAENGYRSFATVYDVGSWSPEQHIANRYVDDAALGPSGALHVVYHLFEVEDIADEGLWYASLLNGVPESRHLSDSYRFANDAPSPPQTLVVDEFGRPHVFYSTPYDEGEEGLWYIVGPPL